MCKKCWQKSTKNKKYNIRHSLVRTSCPLYFWAMETQPPLSQEVRDLVLLKRRRHWWKEECYTMIKVSFPLFSIFLCVTFLIWATSNAILRVCMLQTPLSAKNKILQGVWGEDRSTPSKWMSRKKNVKRVNATLTHNLPSSTSLVAGSIIKNWWRFQTPPTALLWQSINHATEGAKRCLT